MCCVVGRSLSSVTHRIDDPEGGSKEIKEESCHHSKQALTECEGVCEGGRLFQRMCV